VEIQKEAPFASMEPRHIIAEDDASSSALLSKWWLGYLQISRPPW